MKTIQDQLGEATKQYLAQVESRPDIVATRIDTNGDQHSIVVMVRDMKIATKDGIKDLVQSPIIVTLEDGTSVSLPVGFEESKEFVLGH